MNFRNIILPEALKLIQSQEPSLLNALSDLESMVGEVMQPLDSLIGQVDVLHRNAVMGLEVNIDILYSKVFVVKCFILILSFIWCHLIGLIF